MDKKIEWLSRYGKLVEKMKKLEKEIKYCEDIASSVPTVDFSKVPSGSSSCNTSAPFEQWIIRKVDYEQKLEKLKQVVEKVMQETMYAISRICDGELETVLIYRYINCMSWVKIGETIHSSETQVRRLHSKAIEKFQVPK
jgi:DNA-directed RNA polymerase specialized sigma subunit